VNHRDNRKRLLFRRIRDEKIVNGLKLQRSGGEIGSLVTLMRKSHKLANRLQDILTEARGCSKIVLGDELPNLGAGPG
jgi:hypothetical protein